MSPLDRLRIEKAATDCGFEMTPFEREGGLELRSARFPESVRVRPAGAAAYIVEASGALLLGPTRDVKSVNAEGVEALYNILCTAAAHARTLPNRVAEAFRRETQYLPRSTEAERVIVQRVGQNLFRAALFDYWQGRCSVTGLDIPELLRASHVKPWAACDTDDERLDVFNGFLLAPHLDALFDAGWMTITTEGDVRISRRLETKQLQSLGLTSALPSIRLQDGHRHYLAFHWANVWMDG
jgi:putative restriction endonuclease